VLETLAGILMLDAPVPMAEEKEAVMPCYTQPPSRWRSPLNGATAYRYGSGPEIIRSVALRYARKLKTATSVPPTTVPGATQQRPKRRRAADRGMIYQSVQGWFPLFPAVPQHGARARVRMAACRPDLAPMT
jgi:hypothetical protein